jgi:5,10-methylenetetrahydromethanopterin reductase
MTRMARGHRLGIKFAREWAPERLLPTARATEAAGFDELWVVEDLAFHGGFTQAAAALAVTEHITVGLGIAPAVVRNAAYTAMEIATLARVFPGRFHMGFGHGVEGWIDQVGATPASWMTSLREITTAIKQLLPGGTHSFDGSYVQLRDVVLDHPALVVPPISLGVRSPKSMALAGEVADGVIFAEVSGPRYVARLREQLGEQSVFTVFIYASENVDELRSILDWRLSLERFKRQTSDYAGDMPADPIGTFAIGGPQDTWREQAEAWFTAGADSVVYCPLPGDDVSTIESWS